jgi:hypothetical protein
MARFQHQNHIFYFNLSFIQVLNYVLTLKAKKSKLTFLKYIYEKSYIRFQVQISLKIDTSKC